MIALRTSSTNRGPRGRRYSAFCTLHSALLLLPLLAGCRPAGEGTKEPPPPPKLASTDPWKLTIKEPGTARAFLGNGYLGVNASQAGWARDAGQIIPGFISGFYRSESFAPAPEWAAPDIKIGEQPLDAAKARDYEQTFDLRRGVLQTRYRWTGRPNVDVEVTLFPARHSPYLGVLRVALTPRRDAKLSVVGAAVVPQGCAVRLADSAAAGDARPEPWPSYQADLRAGERWVFTRYAGVCAERDAPQAERDRRARRAVEEAERAGFDAVLKAHTAAWEKLWQRDVAIEGDAQAQQVMNALRYFLLASVREGRVDSVPPMGLSSDIYQGHIFWDADTWVFPALVPQYPELARSIVEYRYRTLPAARENARRQGLPGADYAWESAATGRETVAMETNKGRHVNADIALAQWQYYLWTGDREWLRSRGYPVIKATADYWLARVTHNQAAGRYEIRDVLGPDETRGAVDNNAWTNSMAQLNLQVAGRAARLVGERPDPRWSAVAAKLWIPFDKEAGRYRQFGGADSGRAKQADCELILYPRRLPMPPEVAARTYDFYKERVIQNGPAMTSSIYAVIAAQLGRPEEAAQRFRESWEPFLLAPYHLFSEKRTTPRACFITGLAGSLQAIYYGFAGMEPTEEGLRTHAQLPPGWTRLRITCVRWRGQTKDVGLRGGAAPRSGSADR